MYKGGGKEEKEGRKGGGKEGKEGEMLGRKGNDGNLRGKGS